VGRTWLTRPRPEIDRVGSAWLIRKFIDPKASFVFGTDPAKYRNAIPYDMFEVEFSHHGEDCTFETLLKRFGIADKAIQKLHVRNAGETIRHRRQSHSEDCRDGA
jgi:hypothetical protein